jgi:hypothetical protein
MRAGQVHKIFDTLIEKALLILLFNSFISFGHDAAIFNTNIERSDVVIGCFDCQSRYQLAVVVMDRHHDSSISCFCCVVCGSFLKNQVFVGQTAGVTFVD